ncbi:MAG: DNA/RNA nuclease SfsA [Candidatus Heimdallarchaeota archaeon]|nr:DNA/RNA nuclease SfsA [Candidatus Heimdallarchaeota archaeon]
MSKSAVAVLIMKLEENYTPGRFLQRPNRFLSIVEITAGENSTEHVKAHVPDPGRLKELLIPNAEIILRKSDNVSRKTNYSLVGVKKGKIWVNIDSQIANKLFLSDFMQIPSFLEYKIIKSEFTFGRSRIDFLLEHRKIQKRALLEIKSATLVENGVALFPDAPTVRGVKHLNELISSLDTGYEAFVVFVIKREDAMSFTPNVKTDPIFTKTLFKAMKAGVKVITVKCSYDPIIKRELSFKNEIDFL